MDFDDKTVNNSGAFSERGSNPPPPPDEAEILKQKLADAEKRLAQEHEKLLVADVKAKQEEAFAARVEASLKDIQQKMHRDIREREIEEERSELRSKVRELESKLVTERDSWVQLMRAQLQPPAPPAAAAPSGEAAPGILARLDSIERKWAQEKTVRTPDDAVLSQLSRLETELHGFAQEKETLSTEVSKMREAFFKLEKQGLFLDQISSAVLNMRSALDKAASAPAAASGDALERLVDKEIELRGAKGELENLRRVGEERQRLISAKEAEVARASQDKLRAISELLKLRKTLSRIKAVTAALERELAREHAEKEDAVNLSVQRAAEVDSLKADLAAIEDKHQANIAELNRVCQEKSSESENLSAELGRIGAEHENKVAELRDALRSQAGEYEARLAELETAKGEAQEKLSRLEIVQSQAELLYKAKLAELERAKKASQNEFMEKLFHARASQKELETRFEEKLRAEKAEKTAAEREKAAANEQKEFFEKERNQLASEKEILSKEISRLRAEKAELSLHIHHLKQGSESLLRHKQQLDAMLQELEMKSQRDKAVIKDMGAKLTGVESKNAALEAELSRQRAVLADEVAKSARSENELKDLLARETAVSYELRRKVEHYEKLAKNALERLKWAITGKMPQ